MFPTEGGKEALARVKSARQIVSQMRMFNQRVDIMLKMSGVISLIAISILAAGCAGPEQKLGRGFTNFDEVLRGGELRRSIEQSAVFGGQDSAYATGFVHGFDRSMARAGTGLYEMVTFPIPNHSGGDYGPIFHPKDPVYPESYKPNHLIDAIVAPDTNLGFSGGDAAPMIPGSRFHIFDN